MQNGKVHKWILSISMSCWIIFGCGHDSFGAAAQKNGLSEIQDQLLALRNEFKLQIEKVEQDRAVVDEHVRTKLENLRNSQQTLNTSYPELKNQASKLAAGLDAYNDKISAWEQVFATLEATMNKNLDAVETQLASIKKHGFKKPVEAKASNKSQGEEPPTLDGVAPGQLFRAAYRFYMEGDYETAIAGFQKFVAAYSNTPLAGAAQYWIAESFMKLGAYDTAVQEYDALIKKYPQNDKAADAFYGKGMALLKLGKSAEAAPLFKYVREHFQGTVAAKKAEEQLKQP